MTSTPIVIHLPYRVHAKQSFVAGRNMRTRKIQARTRSSTKNNAERIMADLYAHRPGKPIEGPVEVHIVCNYGPRTIWQWRTKAPDVENVAKQVNDCLEAIGFFANDAQVARLVVEKYDTFAFTSTVITVTPL